MPKGYNSLNDTKINSLEIGICPTCMRRLTAECQHGGFDLEREEWYAAWIVAEQTAVIFTTQDAWKLRTALIEAMTPDGTPAQIVDVRTIAERAQDEFAEEVMSTRESDRPM